jgi:solute carrier family 25 S-adenosylmethionine transporter 26
MSSNTLPHSYAMLAGGIAGLSVDVILFPLDTIKTRLQAHGGFRAAGGFSGVYAGLASTASGSIPSGGLLILQRWYRLAPHSSSPNIAALFFLVYESLRGDTALSHVYASAMAETVSCLIRVPTEVVKQRAQTSRHSVISITRQIWSIHGPVGLYRGFGITLLREIPFTSIQFPLYEALKQYWSITMGTPPSPLEAALCGSAAGIVAAALTTPLDVIKTRWILHKVCHRSLLLLLNGRLSPPLPTHFAISPSHRKRSTRSGPW